MFEDPRVGMAHENRMQARCEGRVDVGPRAVSDHPGCARGETILFADRCIGVGIFLGWDFYAAEISGDAGALEFVGLFSLVAFGHEDELVTRGQERQCLAYAIEQLNFGVGN